MRTQLAVVAALAACAACKAKDHAAPLEPAHDGARRDAGSGSAAATADARTGWPELATFPHVDPVRVVELPVRARAPRFDVGGPVVTGDIAIVSSSQIGFAGIDYHSGKLVWTKPAGDHTAPPLVIPAGVAGGIALIGDCINDPEVPAGERLLGCLRVVTPLGADRSYVAVHGKLGAIDEFAAALGPQLTWSVGERTIKWSRGDRAVMIDLLTGTATPAASTTAPPLVVHYKGRTWTVEQHEDGMISAREQDKDAWHTQRSYSAMLGAVYLPEQAPMIRVSNVGRFGGHPEMNLMDIDATGSMHGQVAFPVPGIALGGHAIDAVGDTALAIRLDASLERDFIVGYAANALLMWVYPLPEQQRIDPIGLAVAPDAVVAFHDGDTLTILPELSAPPTAPGAARPPSEIPTP